MADGAAKGGAAYQEHANRKKEPRMSHHHDDRHDLGLGHDLPVMLGRRRLLALSPPGGGLGLPLSGDRVRPRLRARKETGQ